jgi:Uma2 family endonuclease
MLATFATAQAFDAWVQEPAQRGQNWELIRAQRVQKIVTSPKSSACSMLIGSKITAFVRHHKLGVVTDAQGGYHVMDERYIPDVGFLHKDKKNSLLSRDTTPSRLI